MKASKFITIVGAAAFGLIASSVAALAVPAVAKSAVNVRTGPGVGYTKVDTLHKGEAVNVKQCKSGWCYILHSGPDGWVSGNYLVATGGGGGGGGGGGSAANDAAAAAAINVFGTILGAVVNNALPPPPPPPPPPTPTVCFYTGANYTGSNLCVNAGSTNNKLIGFWNDRISSVKVTSGAAFLVCRNWWYGSYCNNYNVNKPTLPWQLNNNISSYKTF